MIVSGVFTHFNELLWLFAETSAMFNFVLRKKSTNLKYFEQKFAV
jgi:hypothetical protein